MRKQGLGQDPAVQTHEDALCLVFLETQFDELADGWATTRRSTSCARRPAKMSPAGLAAVQGVAFSPAAADLLARALSA